MRIVDAVELAHGELVEATGQYGPFASAHEGYAVVLEEVRELEKEVFLNPRERDTERMKKEAIQLAAMAIRFLVDLC
jgi:hypothetical protein